MSETPIAAVPWIPPQETPAQERIHVEEILEGVVSPATVGLVRRLDRIEANQAAFAARLDETLTLVESVLNDVRPMLESLSDSGIGKLLGIKKDKTESTTEPKKRGFFG